jgi:t-SNARE complex subunit (syntaxin)
MFESIKKSAQSFKNVFFQAVQERVAKEVEKAMNQPQSWENWIAHHVKYKDKYVSTMNETGLDGEAEWERVYQDMNKVLADVRAGKEAKVTAVRTADQG